MSTKKIAALIVVFAGVLLSSVILYSNGPKKKTDAPGISLSATSSLSAQFNFNTRTPPPVKDPEADLAVNVLTANKTENISNLTDAASEKYLREVIKKNEGNTELVNRLRIPSQEIFENVLEEQITKDLPLTQLEEKDIRITSDNSILAKEQYLQSFAEITQKNFKKFTSGISDILNDWTENDNPKKLQEYLAIAERQIQDLLSLPVPTEWKNIHLQNLNLWQKKVTIYSAMLDEKNDPLKAIIAIKSLPEIFQENENLQTTLTELVNKLASS